MREKAEKALADLKKQRDGLLSQLAAVNGAVQAMEYVLKEDPPAGTGGSETRPKDPPKAP